MAGRIVIIPAALALNIAGASAQTAPHARPPEPFAHVTDAELAARVAGGPLVLSVLSDHETYYVQAAGRNAPGEPEVHAHWIDYMVIQHGEAQFTYGGTLSGAHETAKGEVRGGTSTGGTTVTLRAGDYLMVPAGQPHLTMIKPGAPFRAFVFKARY